jgi:hypothetical protein
LKHIKKIRVMIKSFRAILNVGGKEQAFAKSSGTLPGLVSILKDNGIGLSQVVRFETFDTMVEKQRGRTPRKY